MARLIALMTLVLSISSNAAPGASGVSAEIIDFGIYLTSVDKTVPAVNTTTQEISLLVNPRLVRQTDNIPGLPKTSFGLRYRLSGLPEGSAIPVTDVVITPGIQNPDSNVPMRYREEQDDMAIVGKDMFIGYTFDKSWEAVPGDWTIEVWSGDRRLLSRAFTVTKTKRLFN